MKSSKQLLTEIPTAASCGRSHGDAQFAIWKLNKLANKNNINVANSPELLKRLTALEKIK